MPLNDSGKTGDGTVALTVAESLQDCLACGLIVIDDQNRVVAFGPEVSRLLHLPASEVLNQPAELLPKPVAEMVHAVRQTGKKVAGRQLLLPQRGKKTPAIHVSALPILYERGGAPSVALVLNDLGPARELEQNMRRLDRLASIGTLAASMAHEIKNAMVPVKTFVDLLAKKHRDGSSEGLLSSVERELDRINSILSQMLRVAGPGRPSFAPLRMHDILDQSLGLVQHQIEGRKIRLERIFKADHDWVAADAYQLEQAFLNLFFNAIEAMGPDGVLTVSTASILPPPDRQDQPEQFRIVIKDSGVGILPENMNRLFETFFTTKPNGTGLGLAITRRIIGEHHGDIQVDSRPNEGTTITLLFPPTVRGA